jgi:hypothetical protein
MSGRTVTATAIVLIFSLCAIFDFVREHHNGHSVPADVILLVLGLFGAALYRLLAGVPRKEAGESADPWQEYRRRRNLAWFAFLGYVPIVGVIALAAGHLFDSMTPGFIVAVGWMVFFLAASFRCQSFRCPRCGKWFFAKWWYHNSFARRCVHCGLPKYASPETDHSDARLRNA